MSRAERPGPDTFEPPEASHLVVRALEFAIGDLHILRSVDLECEAGMITGLIGPNGAGKTTLLNCISGLYRAQAGSICLGEIEINGRSPHRVARAGVARTFQAPQVVDDLTAVQNVELGAHATGWSALLRDAAALFWRSTSDRAVRAEAHRQLDRMGLGHRAEVPARDCSHVERRLIEVSRALCGEPKVLLLDEPCAGMGEDGQRVLASALRQLAADGLTILVIEHNVSFVVDVTDALVVLDRGAVIATGEPRAVLDDEGVLEAYLGQSTGNDEGEDT